MSTQLTVKEFMRQDQVIQSFRDVLGDREANAYVSSVLIAVANSPAIQECSPVSIMSSALRAATLRLSVDPGIGQAYLVPFKGKCTLIIGYKGIRDMAIRTGKYRYLNVSKIYQGEEIVEDRLTGMHSFGGARANREAPVIGWLLYFELISGFRKTYYMTVEELALHAKRYSKSFDRPDNPWNTHREDMERKTVLRMGLTKWGYFDPHDSLALSQLEQADEIVDVEITEAQGDQEPPEPEHQYTEAEILEQLGF